MAQAEQLAGQMGFLTDAAHLLARAAPETSAYLLSQRNAILLSHDVTLSDAQKEHVCGGCGHILFPGHGDSLRIDAGKAVFRKQEQELKLNQKRKERQAGPTKVYTCGICHRYTKVELPTPEPIRRRRKRPRVEAHIQTSTATKAIADKPAQRQPTTASGMPPSANASSKKRAKNRKAGLQALLSQNQSEAANTSGLSLADFLSK